VATLSNQSLLFAGGSCGCCVVFVQDPVEFEVLNRQNASRRLRLGKLCFRRLSACRHIAVQRAPRAPLSFGNRAYYNNSSFSARPNNTLAAKIWYRKDLSTPRGAITHFRDLMCTGRLSRGRMMLFLINWILGGTVQTRWKSFIA
jgi:hypothetical protein